MQRDWRAKSVVLVLAGLALAAGGCGPTSFVITPVSAEPELVESVVMREGAFATRKIALVDIDGLLENGRRGSWLGLPAENPVATFKEKLDKAARDAAVRAVVLRINSPGGSVTASDLMYQEVCEFRRKTGKPVIASMMDLATSGGYYVACAADRILAQPTSVTGSIGVIMITPDLSGTMQKLGVRANVIKSGAMKDAGSPFREMSERDRAVFQGLIDRMYAAFVAVVARSRTNLGADRIRELADGRVYLAPEALELGLIDGTGSLNDSIVAAKELAKIAEQKVFVVQYARPVAHRPNVYAQPPGGPAQVNVVNLELPRWLSHPAPQFLYLWAPGW
ncbi:MAG: signal peptide peptidase SppA [Phycisphaerae bacterium]